jgi:hypothetical protein
MVFLNGSLSGTIYQGHEESTVLSANVATESRQNLNLHVELVYDQWQLLKETGEAVKKNFLNFLYIILP